jgi:adenylate kinase family enzyme
MLPRRIAVLASASGSGKTTLGRALAARLGAPFIEVDALQHLANWTRATPAQFRAQAEPILAAESWVIDGTAPDMVGRLVLDRAELIVWLDLPPWIWLPRLVRRSARRWLLREELWNGNRETLRDIFMPPDGVLPHALRAYFFRRDRVRARLGGCRVLRLTRARDVDAFLASFPVTSV